MVIGNGMIANRFSSYKGNNSFLIFASGVSNSKNTDPEAYKRETDLVIKSVEENRGKTFVYFSTCSIYDPSESSSLYVQHKRNIERYITCNASAWYIFRVSNLAGRSANANTILNFFFYHIINKVNFDLWTDSTRNIIDIDDMYHIIDHIIVQGLHKDQIVNIANPVCYHVQDIITAFEEILHTKANYIPIKKGHSFSIDISLILPVIHQLGLQFGEDYLNTLIRKYYTQK